MENNITLLILFALSLVVFFAVYTPNGYPSAPHQRTAKGGQSVFRGVFGLRYLNNLYLFRKSVLDDVIVPQFEQHGSTHSITILGLRCLFTADSTNIREILYSGFRNFGMGGTRQKSFEPAFGAHSVLTNDGAIWQSRRKLLRPYLQPYATNIVPIIESRIQEFFRITHDRDGSAKVVEIRDRFRDLTRDVISKTLTGKSIGEHATLPQVGACMSFQEAVNIGVKGATIRLLFPRAWYPGFYKACQIGLRFFLNSTQQAVREAASNGPDDQRPETLIDSMAKEMGDPNEMAKELVGLVIAGSLTTASLLSFTIDILARRPAFTSNLRSLVACEFGLDATKQLDVQRALAFQPLQHVINEVLRLYPIVAINIRVALQDCTLPRGGGPDGNEPLPVKKGQRIFIAPYVLHRQREIWGDSALEFDPHRWNTVKPPNWTYIPFHGGYRTCLGRECLA